MSNSPTEPVNLPQLFHHLRSEFQKLNELLHAEFDFELNEPPSLYFDLDENGPARFRLSCPVEAKASIELLVTKCSQAVPLNCDQEICGEAIAELPAARDRWYQMLVAVCSEIPAYLTDLESRIRLAHRQNEQTLARVRGSCGQPKESSVASQLELDGPIRRGKIGRLADCSIELLTRLELQSRSIARSGNRAFSRLLRMDWSSFLGMSTYRREHDGALAPIGPLPDDLRKAFDAAIYCLNMCGEISKVLLLIEGPDNALLSFAVHFLTHLRMNRSRCGEEIRRVFNELTNTRSRMRPIANPPVANAHWLALEITDRMIAGIWRAIDQSQYIEHMDDPSLLDLSRINVKLKEVQEFFQKWIPISGGISLSELFREIQAEAAGAAEARNGSPKVEQKFDALDRPPADSPKGEAGKSLADPLTTIVFYHGGNSYSVSDQLPIVVSNEEHAILGQFLKSRRALATKDLESENPSRIMKQISKKFSGSVRLPRVKGAGYFIDVRQAVSTT